MITTTAEETIGIGQVGTPYKYTACTFESEVPQESLKYSWTVIWQEAKNALDNANSFELQAPTSRVVTLKFLQQGTYTIRCTVSSDEGQESLGTFVENLPPFPSLYEWTNYTACTPDTEISPAYLEYLWIITSEVNGEWLDATPWIETKALNQRKLQVKFNYPGVYKIRAVAFSIFAEDVFQESIVCETIGPIEKIGDVEIIRGKNKRFGAVHRDATAPKEHMSYLWECKGATIELPESRVCKITFPNYGPYRVQCTVTNPWAYDSPVVATWLIEHTPIEPPPLVSVNWQKPNLGARFFPDNNEFLGHPTHGLNYHPHSQANRFWKISLDDIQGYFKDYCLTENETGEIIQVPLDSVHPNIPERWVSVQLINIGTGNQFEDDHMDARLYTMEKEEHPYDYMYVPAHRYFYVGVHRRETKRLPFDIAIKLGDEYLHWSAIKPENRKYIMNLHDISPHW